MKKFSLLTKANSRRNWSRKKQPLAVGLAILAVVFGWLAPTVVMSVASLILHPVLVAQHWLQNSQAALPAYIRDRAALQTELSTLRTKLALTEALKIERDVLRAENDDLRDLANVAIDDTATIIANVIARPPRVLYDRLIINRGQKHGVVTGAPVYAGENVAVGTILTAGPYQSVVELISSPHVKSAVYVFGPDIFTTAVGQGGGVMKIGVPQGIAIAVGDAVSLPVGSRAIVGRISSVDTVPTQPEQFAYVTLPIPLQSISLVRVGTTAVTPLPFFEAQERVETIQETLFNVSPADMFIDITSTTTSSTSTISPTTTLMLETL